MHLYEVLRLVMGLGVGALVIAFIFAIAGLRRYKHRSRQYAQAYNRLKRDLKKQQQLAVAQEQTIANLIELVVIAATYNIRAFLQQRMVRIHLVLTGMQPYRDQDGQLVLRLLVGVVDKNQLPCLRTHEQLIIELLQEFWQNCLSEYLPPLEIHFGLISKTEQQEGDYEEYDGRARDERGSSSTNADKAIAQGAKSS